MSKDRLVREYPEWEIGNEIGAGGFGRVYSAERKEHKFTTSAFKVISIPRSDSEISALRSEGVGEVALTTSIKNNADAVVKEIEFMQQLKGNSNIVSIEDYKVIKKDGAVGYDIFIRMELLTSLVLHIQKKGLSEDMVIKLGLDILTALELCSQKGIVHRDIKPENIFISPHGNFKLGDFGIARELDKMVDSRTKGKSGTPPYMAPEIINADHDPYKKYPTIVDIYSLGIVLYKLLNKNLLPFADQYPQPLQPSDLEKAISRRIKGENLPSPDMASDNLAQIILKACAFNPRDRYQTARQFKLALETFRDKGEAPKFTPTYIGADEVETLGWKDSDFSEQPKKGKFGKKKKSKKPLAIAASFLLVIVIGFAGIFAANHFGIIELPQILADDYVGDILEALEEQDHERAEQIFNENPTIDKVELELALEGRLDVLRGKFLAEEVSYNVARMEINLVSSWDLSGLRQLIADLESFIERLNDSRVAFQVAETQFERGDFRGAIEHFRLVIMEDPNFRNATEGLNRAIEEYRNSALSIAASYAAALNFSQAVFVIEGAVTIVGNDAELVAQRENYRRQDLANRISEAQAVAAGGNFTGALATLRALETQNTGNVDIIRVIAAIENDHANHIIETANALSAADRFDDAARELNEGLRLYPANTALTIAQSNNEQLRFAAQEREVDSLLAQANTLAENGQYEEAISLLQGSRHSMNSRVRARVTELRLIIEPTPTPSPVPTPTPTPTPRTAVPFLVAAPIFESSNVTTLDSVTMSGERFSPALGYGGNFFWTSGWSRHVLGREYTQLSGTFGRIDGSSRMGANFEFMGDGIVIETFTIGEWDLPMQINVDVTDVQVIQIRITTDAEGGRFAFAESTLR